MTLAPFYNLYYRLQGAGGPGSKSEKLPSSSVLASSRLLSKKYLNENCLQSPPSENLGSVTPLNFRFRFYEIVTGLKPAS